jgi:hypothetical protein
VLFQLHPAVVVPPQQSEHLQNSVSDLPTGSEAIVIDSETGVVCDEPTKEKSATENNVVKSSLELVVPLRPNARRKSATLSNVQPSPITTRRNSRKTIGTLRAQSWIQFNKISILTISYS